MMKVSVLKIVRNKEVVNRMAIDELAELIRSGEQKEQVKELRMKYHLMKLRRLEDGQVETSNGSLVNLPRICFAMEVKNQNKERMMVGYSGLVVLEVNGMESYEQAIRLRTQASRMPQTVMAFLGASGKSVKIVCRGELFGDCKSPAHIVGDCKSPTTEPPHNEQDGVQADRAVIYHPTILK